MISTLLMICAAMAPAIMLAYIITRRDEGEPEPRKWLIISAASGIVAALLAVASVMLTLPDFEVETFGGAIVDAFCRAAIPEECFKLLMLYLVAKCCESFNEVFDGIIYAVCVGMGFAGFENILYLMNAGDGWLYTGIMRALVSVAGHYFFGIIMGAFFSISWFDIRNRTLNAFLALVLPVLANGIFDTLLMAAPVAEYGAPLIALAFLLFFRQLRRYAASLVDRRLALDRTVGKFNRRVSQEV